MRVYGPSGTRSFPYDRNPSTVILASSAQDGSGVGPVTLISYTVPAARRALLTCCITIEVDAALAAGQQGEVNLFVASSGSAGPRLRSTTASPAGQHMELAVPGIQVRAGEVTLVQHSNSAGAGIIHISGLIHGVEYDA